MHHAAASFAHQEELVSCDAMPKAEEEANCTVITRIIMARATGAHDHGGNDDDNDGGNDFTALRANFHQAMDNDGSNLLSISAGGPQNTVMDLPSGRNSVLAAEPSHLVGLAPWPGTHFLSLKFRREQPSAVADKPQRKTEHWEQPVPGVYEYKPGRGWYLIAPDDPSLIVEVKIVLENIVESESPLEIQSSTIFPFMKLSGELRNLVYLFALKSETSTKLVRGQNQGASSIRESGTAENYSGPNFRLLEVNRKINKEATAFFYHYNTFAVSATEIRSALSATAYSSIESLELGFPELDAEQGKHDDRQVLRTVSRLPALRELIINLEGFYTNASAHSLSARAMAAEIVNTFSRRREAGRGDVKLEFIKSSFKDFQQFHRVLYPESNE